MLWETDLPIIYHKIQIIKHQSFFKLSLLLQEVIIFYQKGRKQSLASTQRQVLQNPLPSSYLLQNMVYKSFFDKNCRNQAHLQTQKGKKKIILEGLRDHC